MPARAPARTADRAHRAVHRPTLSFAPEWPA